MPRVVAALSVGHITGKPIKFLYGPRRTDHLEPFHPDRIASRILAWVIVLSLIEQAETQARQDKARESCQKSSRKGQGFGS